MILFERKSVYIGIFLLIQVILIVGIVIFVNHRRNTQQPLFNAVDALVKVYDRQVREARLTQTFSSPEVDVDTVLASLLENIRDQRFQQYLRSKRLIVSEKARENEDYLFFDFTNEQGNRVGSIGVQKIHGEIYLFDKEEGIISPLKFFTLNPLLEDKKKSLNLSHR